METNDIAKNAKVRVAFIIDFLKCDKQLAGGTERQLKN